MLQYKKIDVSETINTNRRNASKECTLCHYWHFKYVGFKFRCNIWGISRDEAVNRLNDSALEVQGVL